MSLSRKKCMPCEGGVPPLAKEQVLKHLKEVPDWELSTDGKTISVRYTMKDFAAAIELIRRIARAAEQEGHHPDIHLTGYRRLQIELSTHSIGNLSENDFILAAKISRLQTKKQQV